MPLVSIPSLYKNNFPTDAADGNDVLYKKKFLIDEYRSRRFKSCRSLHKKYLQETFNFALDASIAKKKIEELIGQSAFAVLEIKFKEFKSRM